MKQYSLRIEQISSTSLALWVDDRSSTRHADRVDALPFVTSSDPAELYQAITRCVLQIKARGDRVQYIDLPGTRGLRRSIAF